MTERENETQPESVESSEPAAAVEAVEATEATATSFVDRAWEAVGAARIEAHWGQALGKARSFLEARPLEAPLTHLRQQSQQWLRTGRVARAQQRGAELLLGLVQPVRQGVARVEATLRAAQAEVAEEQDEGRPAAA